MYDTVHIWKPFDEGDQERFTSTGVKLLRNSCLTKWGDGTSAVSGILGNNMRIRVNDSGISIKGSLSKYWFGDNNRILNPINTANAITNLSDELGIQINNGKVTRLDIAANVVTNHLPESYYPYLVDSPHFSRTKRKGSLYFGNGLRQKVFYNKIAECRSKKTKIPDEWSGCHVMRYEVRYTARIGKRFKIDDFTVNSLITPLIGQVLIDAWFKEYHSINRVTMVPVDWSRVNTPNDIIRQLAIIGLNKVGLSSAIDLVKSLPKTGGFKRAESRSRLRKLLIELSLENGQSNNIEAPVTELDEKILLAAQSLKTLWT